MKNVAIVIPIYKNIFSIEEQLSLAQWKKYLSDYDTFSISPPGINSPNKKIQPVFFATHDFDSVKAYSQLMLSRRFYEKFKGYKYILIYQLDALVLNDTLKSFLNQNFSYIGAPWTTSIIGRFTSFSADLRGGNGGLSLRCVDDCLKVIEKTDKYKLKSKIQIWMELIIALLTNSSHALWMHAPAHQYPFNEDGFWSFEATKYDSNFKASTAQQSLNFAFERDPEKCFRKNKNQLPFGCHAWEKYDKSFWIKNLPFHSS